MSMSLKLSKLTEKSRSITKKISINSVAAILLLAPLTSILLNSSIASASNVTVSQTASFQDPNPQPGDYFGYSLATSGDGTLAVVGSPNSTDSNGNADAGAAYVYSNTGSGWNLITQLTPTDSNQFNNFGTSVAMTPDGSEIVVGAVWSPTAGYTGATQTGSAYIFQAPVGGWTAAGSTTNQSSELSASDLNTTTALYSTPYFGNSVSVSNDGQTVAVAAKYQNNGAGEAYVYRESTLDTNNHPVWPATVATQTSTLLPGDPAAGNYFGFSVNLSGDGSTIVVGAPSGASSTSTPGTADVYSLASESAWDSTPTPSVTQELSVLGGNAANSFGESVGVSTVQSDGSYSIIVGAPGETENSNPFQGAAYVYNGNVNNPGSLTQVTPELIASDGVAGDEAGFSVDISSDGQNVLVGAPDHAIATNPAVGVSYQYTNTAGAWTNTSEMDPTPNSPGLNFGYSVFLVSSPSSSVIGAPDLSGGSQSASATAAMRTNRLINGNAAQSALFAKSLPYNCNSGNGTAYSFNGSAPAAHTASTLSTKPVYKSISATSVTPGGSVTVKGSNLLGATAVDINGCNANILSDTATSVKIQLPSNLVSGTLTIYTPSGYIKTPLITFLAPTITSLSKTSAKAGTKLVIHGTNLAGVSSVVFANNVIANITAKTSTSVTVTVPTNALKNVPSVITLSAPTAPSGTIVTPLFTAL